MAIQSASSSTGNSSTPADENIPEVSKQQPRRTGRLSGLALALRVTHPLPQFLPFGFRMVPTNSFTTASPSASIRSRQRSL